MRFLLIIFLSLAFQTQAEVLDDVVGSRENSPKVLTFEFLSHPIEIDSPYVLLGDIARCKNSEDTCRPYLAYLISLAPDLGKPILFTDASVAEILKHTFPDDVFKISGRGIQVTAARESLKENDKSNVIKMIDEAIIDINKELLTKNQRVIVDKINFPALWNLRKSEKNFKLENLTTETLKLKFVTLRAEYIDEFAPQTLQIPVQTSLEYLLPIALHSFANNYVLKAEDFELTWIKSNQFFLGSKNFISNPSELIGKAVKGYIQTGQPIARQMVNEPLVVTRGQAITLLLQVGDILLRSKAQAMDQGSIGQTIEVTNSLTKKRMRARIINHESVMAL